MKYELSFIISSAIAETEHEAVKQEILGYLSKAKATIVREPYFIGRKKLAYPIKKQKHGFYAFLEFESEEAANLKELDINLRHNNNILRHLIIKLDKITSQINADPSKLEEKPVVKRNVSEKRTFATRPAPAKRPMPIEHKKVEDKNKLEKAGVVLEDIDKKLDDILKDTNID